MRMFEERLGAVEAAQQAHAAMIDGLQENLALLRADMNRRFEAVDRRFDAVDRRFDAIDGRFASIDGRFDLLDAKVSRQFVWLVGVQVMTLATLVTGLGAILAAVARL